MARRLITVLLALTLLAAACGDGDGSDDTGSTDTGADTTSDTGGDTTSDTGGDTTSDTGGVAEGYDDTEVGEAKPEVPIPDGDATNELVVTDLVEGTGTEITEGSRAELHYVGSLYDTGEEFDSSWDRGDTFDVVVGTGQVIQGWDQGLIGMKEGGRRRLIIPPELGYGDADQGTIPPNSTLVFVVDLLSVQNPVDVANEPEPDLPDEAPDELVVTDRVVGEGPEVKLGDTAQVLLLAAFLSNGEVFESGWRQGGFPIDLPVGRTIEGLDQGLVGMQVGGLRQLVVPPELAYGAEGSPDGAIPPDETIVFVIELFGIDPAEYESVDPDDAPTPEAPAAPVTELEIDDIEIGEGPELASGDLIAAHYVGVAQSTGEVFDSSWTSGQPIEFTIGVGQVIEGWDEGLIGMQVGGRRQLTIPGDLAYGEAGRPPRIAANDTLVFVVDLVAIVEADEVE